MFQLIMSDLVLKSLSTQLQGAATVIVTPAGLGARLLLTISATELPKLWRQTFQEILILKAAICKTDENSR